MTVKVSASFSESEDHKRESDYRATTTAKVTMTRVPTPEPVQRVLQAFMKIVDVECKITEAIIEGNAAQVAQQKGLLASHAEAVREVTHDHTEALEKIVEIVAWANLEDAGKPPFEAVLEVAGCSQARAAPGGRRPDRHDGSVEGAVQPGVGSDPNAGAGARRAGGKDGRAEECRRAGARWMGHGS